MFDIANQEHIDSWYAATANDRQTRPRLQGKLKADVCVIGAGLTGISTALNLAERGYSVVVLEAARVGWAASGRNGGQMIYGFACGMDTFAKDMPDADVQRMWQMGQYSLEIIKQRVARHQIDCDLTLGYLTAANKPRHVAELKDWQQEAAERYGYQGFRYVEAGQMGEHIQSSRYMGGLYDPDSGHLHPLNYTLGLARAAEAAGAQLFEHSMVSDLQLSSQASGRHTVKTAEGEVDAGHVVLACNAYLDQLAPKLRAKIMPVGTYVIATEPLGEARAKALIPSNVAICDSRFVLDYFRRTSDHRMLWGGKVSYSTFQPYHLAEAMRADMLKVFPQLADVKVTHAWGGFVDITMSRAPHFGRLTPTVYFAQGFSGHGVNITGLAGELMAEAIAGQSERFDLYGKLKHHDFPGGKLLRTPALVLAMMYYRLKDYL